MKLVDVMNLIENGNSFRFDISDFSEKDDICLVKDMLPLPIIVSSYIKGDVANHVYDIELLDKNNKKLGYICLCSQMPSFDLNMSTDAQYAAYIYEVDRDEFGFRLSFKSDYIVLYADRYDEYVRDYMSSSALWGGFTHKTPKPLIPNPYGYLPLSIIAYPDIKYSTQHHIDTCASSVAEPYGFERFLKLYHLLELLFDFDVVRKIQALGDDLHGIGQIMRDYQRQDIERLRYVVKSKCTDIASLESKINILVQDVYYLNTAKDVFFKYGKTENPIEEESNFTAIIQQGGFSFNIVKNVIKRIQDNDKYNNFIIQCSTYWIYRIRCSIAHKRIGEYVMKTSDERFVVDFGEMLLREVLRQVFTV